MSNFLFYIIFGSFIALGGFFSHRLSVVDNLETFKVLNVIGLFYDIVGLVILSQLLSQSERFQKFIANIFSGLLMWAHMGIPIGLVLVGIFLSNSSGFPSAKTAIGIGAGTFMWMLIPSFMVEDVVFRAKTKWFQTAQSRSKFLGGFLLLTGLLVQFVAAIKDLGV